MKCFVLKSDYKITMDLTIPVGAVFVRKRDTIVHFLEKAQMNIVFSDEILEDKNLFDEKEVQTVIES